MNPINHTEDHTQSDERIRHALRESLQPIGNDAEPQRDLWPAMLKRLDEDSAPVPWFDWALLAGLIGVGAFIPASIPVLLYYL